MVAEFYLILFATMGFISKTEVFKSKKMIYELYCKKRKT